MKKVNRNGTAVKEQRRPSQATRVFVLVVLYVAVVLGVDALAALGVSWPFNWGVFHWRVGSAWTLFGLSPPAWTVLPVVRAFDAFKFLFWFVLPFCVCIPRMQWSWFSIRNWKRLDWALLGCLLLLGAAAVLSVNFIPSLRNAYPGVSHLPWSQRWLNSLAALVWVGSWLAGWEFLHRYVLLRAAAARFPRFGWLLVPLSETVYHLQKPGLEMAGMALFSLALTWWSLKRKNLALPFIAHLYIEIVLILALMFLL